MLATAYAYPEDPTPEDRDNYAAYFNTVASVLPCPKCRRHFAELLREHPVEPHLGSGSQLQEWIIERKNDVNRRLGKDCPTMQHVCKTWNQKLYRKQVQTATVVGLTVGVFALCVLLAALFFWLGTRSKSRKPEKSRLRREPESTAVGESSTPMRPPPPRRAVTRSRPLVESYVPTSP
jgi:hypothetical protein